MVLLPLVVKAVHSTRSEPLNVGTTGILLLFQLALFITLQATGDYLNLWWYPPTLVTLGAATRLKIDRPSAAKNP